MASAKANFFDPLRWPMSAAATLWSCGGLCVSLDAMFAYAMKARNPFNWHLTRIIQIEKLQWLALGSIGSHGGWPSVWL